ncbi:MAG: ATP-binding protein [Prevotella sp.]
MALSEIDTVRKKIVKAFHKATATYRLLEDGDRILVGLSGGKDSLLLLELLAQQARIDRPAFTIEAAHVRMQNVKYESDTSYLERFASSVGVRLHVLTTQFDDTIPTKKPVCFLCSWYRRKALFNLAQQLHCNKIALGHHQDDIIHTMMMNLFFQGHFNTMPASLQMSKMPVTLIRPMCLVREQDVARYAALACYEKQLKSCPYETASHRHDIRLLFEQIERLNPEARNSIWNAMDSLGLLNQ